MEEMTTEDSGNLSIPVSLVGLGSAALAIDLTVCIVMVDSKLGMHACMHGLAIMAGSCPLGGGRRKLPPPHPT